MILLTPGPCMTSDTVRAAGAMPDLNHRDPEFLELVREVRSRLLGVYPDSNWVPYLLGGSGTAAVEAMVTSCVSRGPVLVIDNGYYSARIADILAVHRIPYEVFVVPWEDPIPFDTLANQLTKGFEALICTHHETTLGRLNDVAAIAKLCRLAGTRYLVDAMSSFGADLADWQNVDAIASSANKCLHGIPGVAFVLVRPKLAEDMKVYPRRSYYLSLPMYEGESPPLTPPVPALAAFRQALREFSDQGGIEARHARYFRQISRLRNELRARGITPLVESSEASCTLVAANLPRDWSFKEFYEANHDAGFVLYEVKGPYRDKAFQVSVMGEVTDQNLRDWLSAVDQIVSATSR